MHEGDLIRKLREEHNMSQEVLAEKVGVSQQYISALECGNLNPTVKNLKKVLAALNYSIYLKNTS